MARSFCDVDLAHRAVFDQLDPSLARSLGEGAAEQPVLDLMVARAPDRGGDAGLQMRLALARLRRGQPVQIEAEPLLEFVGMAQRRGVIAVERDDHRALAAILDRDAGGGFEFAGEIGPQALAFERQRQERLLAGLGLDRGGQHAGRRPARAMPGHASIVNGDGAAGLREPPRDAEADDAGADDDCPRPLLRNRKAVLMTDSPPPGMPGQVHWV